MDAMYPPKENVSPAPAALASYQPDAGWHWHDAALIVFERQDGGRSEYAVGAVDLYANAQTGDLGGSYLELGAFDNLDRAADLYGRMQAAVDERMLLPFQLAGFLDERLHERGQHIPAWRAAGAAEYAAYEAVRSLEMPDLAIAAEYSFATGVSEKGEPALQAVKRWHDHGEAQEARQVLDTYGMSEEAAVAARELNALVESEGLDQAMALASDIALRSGEIQSDGDGRLFRDGPPDRFTGDRTADLVLQFHDALADGNSRLLEPADPVVNYSFDLVSADPYTMELHANKWWFGEDGALRKDALTLNSYALESFGVEREGEREAAAMDREGLHETHREEGLEASMRKAEALAVAHGALDPDRADGRLFYEGPPDRFTTLRALQLAGREHEAAVPQRDEWQELLERAENDQPEPEPHFWMMQHRPVETPDGESLGTALVMIAFPQLTPDFGAYLQAHGLDDSAYPTEARTMEIGRFANAEASKKFEAEFRSYLVPGVLDGPDLAPEVARLEGLSGRWEIMEDRDIVEHMRGGHTRVLESADWRLHGPGEEQAAGLHYPVSSDDIEF